MLLHGKVYQQAERNMENEHSSVMVIGLLPFCKDDLIFNQNKVPSIKWNFLGWHDLKAYLFQFLSLPVVCKSNPIICNTLIQPRIFHGNTAVFNPFPTVRCRGEGRTGWALWNQVRLGTGFPWTAHVVYCCTQGHCLILQSFRNWSVF